MSKPREQALKYAERFGWYVFPVWVGHDEFKCDGGTRSCKTIEPIKDWPHEASCDPEVIGSWNWSFFNGWGIACGPSGLFVVDVDPGGAWSINGTRVHSTGRGTHHIYEDFIGLRNTTLGPGLDSRGDGGFIVGPGSHHPHGEYTVLLDVDPSPCPQELYDLVAQAQTRPVISSESSDPYDGPPFQDMDEDDQLRAQEYLSSRLAKWEDRFQEALSLPEGQPDSEGRRWDQLAADCAWNLMLLELSPWVPLDDGEQEYRRLVPFEVAAAVGNKWTKGRLRLAEKESVKPPPWTHASEDFEFAVDDDKIFRTPELARMRDYALANKVGSPVSFLAACISRALVEAHPSTRIVGGICCTYQVALVGKPGAGKSRLFRYSRKYLGLEKQREIEIPRGTAQGIVQSFFEKEKDPITGKPTGKNVLIRDPRRFVWVDEIGGWDAKEQKAFLEDGRTAFSGGLRGQQNAGEEYRRVLKDGSYQESRMFGVHPDDSRSLVHDKLGTPERILFAWVREMFDLSEWEEERELDWISPWEGEADGDAMSPPSAWVCPEEVVEGGFVIQAPRAVQRKFMLARNAEGGLGHELELTMKTATGVALLHGDVVITQLWWEIAEAIVEHSFQVQAKCKAATKDLEDEVAEAAGRTDGVREVSKSAAVAKSMGNLRLHILKRCEGGSAWKPVYDTARPRELAVGVREQLIAEGRLRKDETRMDSGRMKVIYTTVSLED